MLLTCSPAKSVSPMATAVQHFSSVRPRGEPLQWRALLDHVDLPDIGEAKWFEGKRTVGESDQCLGGWKVETDYGELFVDHRLGVRWGGSLYERWPPVDRVARDAYRGMPRPVWTPLLRCAHCAAAPPWPLSTLHEFSDATFFDAVLEGADDRRHAGCHRAGSVDRPSRHLIPIVAIRFAEMRGRDAVARELVAAHADALRDLPALATRLAKWRLEWGWWALANGMPRSEIRRAWRQAVSMDSLPEPYKERLERAAGRLGMDPATEPAAGSISRLAALLAEDAYFPSRVWTPAHCINQPRLAQEEWPTWARLDGEQPLSPAWELVAIGWPALPELRGVMESDVALRRCATKIETDGTLRVVSLGTVGKLALNVASTIAARRFEDVAAFDRWWVDVGREGAVAAHARALVDDGWDVVIDRVVWDLLADSSVDPWPLLAAGLAGPEPRRVAFGIEQALWPRPGGQEPAADPDDHLARMDETLEPLLADPVPARREAAARLLALSGLRAP